MCDYMIIANHPMKYLEFLQELCINFESLKPNRCDLQNKNC